MGRIYQQTFVDNYSNPAFAKLYNMRMAFTAADILNDRVLLLFESRKIQFLRILNYLGTEYCGKLDAHDYQLYLVLNDIDHTKTKAESPENNRIVERFHRAILGSIYQIAFRKKIYNSFEEVQVDLDEWIVSYNKERPHQGKISCGRTPTKPLIIV